MKTQEWVRGLVGTWVLVLLWSAGAGAAAPEVEGAMADLKAKAEAVKSYSADMTMTMQMMGKEIKSTGKMLAAKPDKIRMEMETVMGNMNMKQMTVSDGETTWSYQPMMNMVTKIDMSKLKEVMPEGNGTKAPGTSDLTTAFDGLQQDTIAFKGEEQLDGVEVLVFEGDPKMPDGEPQVPFKPSKIRLWVATDDGLPRKMAFVDENGQVTMMQTYSNVKINPEIPEGTFTFTPPENAQVMDMTQGTLNMMKSMQSNQPAAAPQQ